jgi:hypothetical protein
VVAVALLGIVAVPLPFLPLSPVAIVMLREAMILLVVLHGLWVWRLHHDLRAMASDGLGLAPAYAGSLVAISFVLAPVTAAWLVLLLLRALARRAEEARPELAPRLRGQVAQAARVLATAIPWLLVVLAVAQSIHAHERAGSGRDYAFERLHGVPMAIGVSLLLAAGAAHYLHWLARSVPALYRLLGTAGRAAGEDRPT